VLALEVYDDGLIVRFLIPHEGDFPYPPWEGQFALSDDVGTTYRFDGALVGGRPAHGVVTFSPAAPPDARWVDVVSPAGRAHFQLS
jgi:hypothetical protein